MHSTPGSVGLLQAAAAAAAVASGGLYGPGPGNGGLNISSVTGSRDPLGGHHGPSVGGPSSASFGAALYLNSLYNQAAAVTGSRLGANSVGSSGTLKPFAGLGATSTCDPTSVTTSALYRYRPFISPIF